MLNTFPNLTWIESYGQNTGTMQSLPDPRFFHDIWRSNRGIFVILMPTCSLACWLQLCCLPLCGILSGLGVMIFPKSGCAGIWVPLLLAAARVYALNFLPQRCRHVLHVHFILSTCLYLSTCLLQAYDGQILNSLVRVSKT